MLPELVQLPLLVSVFFAVELFDRSLDVPFCYSAADHDHNHHRNRNHNQPNNQSEQPTQNNSPQRNATFFLNPTQTDRLTNATNATNQRTNEPTRRTNKQRTTEPTNPQTSQPQNSPRRVRPLMVSLGGGRLLSVMVCLTRMIKMAMATSHNGYPCCTTGPQTTDLCGPLHMCCGREPGTACACGKRHVQYQGEKSAVRAGVSSRTRVVNLSAITALTATTGCSGTRWNRHLRDCSRRRVHWTLGSVVA